MKLLITGSRKFNDSQALNEAIQNVEKLQGEKVTMLLHGGAIGADTLAQDWADENKIPTQIIKPDYQKHGGKIAPLLRNKELVKLADCTLALYSKNRTGGTWYTSQKTIEAGKPLYEYMTTKELIYTAPVQSLFLSKKSKENNLLH